MKKIMIASQNKGKIIEYEYWLKPLGYTVYSLLDFPIGTIDETGDDFKTNALIKARALSNHLQFTVLADDSGLLVDALNGLPGVHSRRFSESGTDHANNIKLLRVMENIANRHAKFVCVIALLIPNQEPMFFEGTVYGTIHTVIEGNKGFGYDPLFIPEGYHETFGTLNETVKHNISHRKKAFKQCLDYLKTLEHKN